MKRLVLLLIPLVFLFSCEKDNPGASVAHANNQSNNNDNCNCGEVVGNIYYDAVIGEPAFDVNDKDCDGDNTDLVAVGAMPDYVVTELEHNCTGESMTVCENLDFGQIFCGIADEVWGEVSDMECEMVSLPCLDLNTNLTCSTYVMVQRIYFGGTLANIDSSSNFSTFDIVGEVPEIILVDEIPVWLCP